MDKSKLLRKAIACYKIDTGYDMRYIAHKVGVSESGLYDKVAHPEHFRFKELLALVRLLRLDDTQKLQIMTWGCKKSPTKSRLCRKVQPAKYL